MEGVLELLLFLFARLLLGRLFQKLLLTPGRSVFAPGQQRIEANRPRRTSGQSCFVRARSEVRACPGWQSQGCGC